jgi:iron complex transport system permease protein
MSRRRSVGVIAVCIVFLLIAAVIALTFGAVRLSLPLDEVAVRILRYVRLPRLFAAVLAGAGLAVSGVIIQTVLANPLASPGIIGVNAGAGLFAVIAMVYLPGVIWAIPALSFIGALLTVMLVYGIARKAGASRMTLILSGVAISSFMTAGINTLANLNPEILRSLRDFQTGGFSGVSARLLFPASIVIGVSLIIVLLFGGELDVLGLGEETAQSLGLNVKLYRFMFLAVAAALAGAAVSFAGLLSFIGLMMPHIARLILRRIGIDGKRTLIAVSALLGAAFLTLCDTLARTLFSPHELPVGILVSFLGVPFFLWLLFRRNRGKIS